MLKKIFLIIINLKCILQLKEINPIQIHFFDDFSVPLINLKINGIQIEAIIDNNLNFNYITTQNFDISDIRYYNNNDSIIIKDKAYLAYYFNGSLSIQFENIYLNINNFFSILINEKFITSSIMISDILQELKRELLIDRQLFYLDLNHKKCFFGQLSIDSKEYKQIHLSNFEHSISYSKDTKGIFKEKINKLYIEENCIDIKKNVSFKINEEFTYVPYFMMEEIIKDEKIKNLDCKLSFDNNFGYAIICNKDVINILPNLYFVFSNFTFKIPFSLLFEHYDSTSCISSIRNKIKIINNEEYKKEEYTEEWVIGYSIIKYFNYTLFDYDERSIKFYSDTLIGLEPYKNKKEISKNIFYLLSFILGISSIFLFIVRLKINIIPLEARIKN